MTQIVVTAEYVSDLSSQVSQGASSINGELQSLMSKVNGLVESGWTGAASNAFHEMYSEWQTSAANLNSALDGIAGLLSQAATAYSDTESSIQGAMHLS